MAEEGDVLTNLDNPGAGANGADTQPSAGLITQYIKDLSVENPNAPAVYQWTEQPNIDVQFNIGHDQISQEVHEVTLKIKLHAKSEKGNVYLIELDYCGLCGVRNLAEEQTHAFLFAEAPRLLFPFARRVVADAVRDAGFPPMMLDPIDFNGLYLQQLARKQQEEAAAASGADGDTPVGQA